MGGQRSRPSLVLGMALLLVGVLLLGLAGWAYLGTTWVSRREHTAIVERLEDAWAEGRGGWPAASSEASAVVRIPAFGDSYAVPLLEGADDEQLASGFGLVPGSVTPGRRGNLVIAGHRVTHGEPLRDMPALVAGDRVMVETRHEVLTYVLDTGGQDLTVDLDEAWVLGGRPVDPLRRGVEPSRSSERLLTLVTCASLFETEERLVAFGHLASRVPKR
ncbi:class E sortase [Nocardioides sp. IC4_145]|uniref:sortase domain-containing protein n=1 Tax=Nocardioides sp. IC4_145 TaxID=2714037 RepID=UPI00140723A2|nr:sortase [Nocardioides sp. IC4_145]NHC24309.1 class E sortase [Nocardioides sp. IC4_145]